MSEDGRVTTSATPSSFLLSARGQRPATHPVWFMRQAGRSLPEYRAVREGIGMLESCRRPDLVVEITTQPVRRHGVDAAVLFSDIVVPLAAAGVELEIVAGVGPVVAHPVRDDAGLAALRPLTPDDVPYVTEAVRALAASLPVPVLGFAGAPFTLASYLIEGGPSRQHLKTKQMMYAEPQRWHALLSRLAVITAGFLRVQVDAGAAAVQLFDSWVGTLSEADYRRYVLPHSAAVLAAVADVPRIHFGVGTGELLPAMAEAGADIVGVDWRVPLDVAARRVPGAVLQGNIDNAVVATAPWEVVAAAVDDVLARGAAAPGHIVNLGHGVLPETDPDVLTRIVERVHAAPVL